MPDMNSDLKCRVCNPEPNTHWFTQSAVDELTAGLRATLEARTAALTRTIDRAEKAETERDEAQEHVAYHLRDYSLNSEATGDLAVDMAAYSGRMRTRAEKAEEKLRQVEALADEWATLSTIPADCSYADLEKASPAQRTLREASDDLRDVLGGGR